MQVTQAPTSSYRVVRGGSWWGGARYARASNRSHRPPDDALDLVGFRPSKTNNNNKDKRMSSKMINIPASDKVTAFQIAETPVTKDQYNDVMGMPNVIDGTLPVTEVSWFDAVNYCNAISAREGLAPCYRRVGDMIEFNPAANGYRLPSEEEWVHACMGGGTEDPYGPIDDVAWHYDNSGGKVHPVGQKRPNDYGLYDMLGNVWEWTNSTYYQEATTAALAQDWPAAGEKVTV